MLNGEASSETTAARLIAATATMTTTISYNNDNYTITKNCYGSSKISINNNKIRRQNDGNAKNSVATRVTSLSGHTRLSVLCVRVSITTLTPQGD